MRLNLVKVRIAYWLRVLGFSHRRDWWIPYSGSGRRGSLHSEGT